VEALRSELAGTLEALGAAEAMVSQGAEEKAALTEEYEALERAAAAAASALEEERAERAAGATAAAAGGGGRGGAPGAAPSSSGEMARLRRECDAARAEATAREVAALSQAFSAQVASQATVIEGLYTDALKAVENVGRGNVQLAKANAAGASSRRLSFYALVAAALAILLADWLSG
jgi:hypothetical protein